MIIEFPCLPHELSTHIQSQPSLSDIKYPLFYFKVILESQIPSCSNYSHTLLKIIMNRDFSTTSAMSEEYVNIFDCDDTRALHGLTLTAF